jgi:hypothetical protein
MNAHVKTVIAVVVMVRMALTRRMVGHAFLVAKCCARLCPQLYPGGAIIDPKPPPVSHVDKEKPLGKPAIYRGVLVGEGGV